MPKNFLDGCEAVRVICESNPRVLPEHVDLMLTCSELSPSSNPEYITMIPRGDGKLDPETFSLAARTAANCALCTQASQCMLGEFFRQNS